VRGSRTRPGARGHEVVRGVVGGVSCCADLEGRREDNGPWEGAATSGSENAAAADEGPGRSICPSDNARHRHGYATTRCVERVRLRKPDSKRCVQISR
jgi:hypothetical protein